MPWPSGYVQRGELGRGASKVVFEASPVRKPAQRVAVSTFPKGAPSTLAHEVEMQKLAASIGIAPPVLESGRDYFVSPVLDGGSLLGLVKKQGGTLSDMQQDRLIEILQKFGTVEGLTHSDMENPNNYVADGVGKLYLIDYGAGAKKNQAEQDRQLFGDASDRYLYLIAALLWQPRWGLAFPGKPASLRAIVDAHNGARRLVDAYLAYASRSGKRSPWATPQALAGRQPQPQGAAGKKRAQQVAPATKTSNTPSAKKRPSSEQTTPPSTGSRRRSARLR